MGALFDLPLALDASCDFFAFVTCIGQDYVPLEVDCTSAILEIRATALDVSPLVTVTTTSGSSGGLLFGVALPPPAGAQCATESAVTEHGLPGSVSTVPPVVNQGSVATLAALSNLDATSFTEGDVVFVTSTPGLFFQWSPGDPRPANGTTIVAGFASAGKWLLACTVVITLTAQALAAIAGYDFLVYDLIVTWSDGTKTKFLGRRGTVDQTIS